MEYKPGDIVLVHGTGFFDQLIQFGQSIRFGKPDAFYNHVAIIISTDGDIIEAVAKGVKRANISKYAALQTKIIPTNLDDHDIAQALAFANSCLSEGYGWTTIISTALCLLFGLRFSFGFSGEDICSGLVARCLERGNAIFPSDPRHLTPADLAKYFTHE